MKKNLKKNKKGFTLVEMIVVIAIIGVLAAMMVPSLVGYIEKAHISNNITAATTIGRTAQTIVSELNDITTNDVVITYDGSGWKNGATAIGSGTTKLDTLANELNKMAQPQGNCQITVVAGKITRVVYSKSKTVAEVGSYTSESNKDFGVYPQ